MNDLVPADEYTDGWSSKELPVRIHFLDGRIVACGSRSKN